MKKEQKIVEEIQKLEQENGELLQDLQRTRADFENFRKNVEENRERVKKSAKQAMAYSLLGVIDDIERATNNAPDDLKDNAWAKGILTLNKKLEAELKKVGIEKIETKVGDVFNPELHEAVMVEESDGDEEVVSEILRTGYKYDGDVMRHVSVKVKNQ